MVSLVGTSSTNPYKKGQAGKFNELDRGKDCLQCYNIQDLHEQRLMFYPYGTDFGHLNM